MQVHDATPIVIKQLGGDDLPKVCEKRPFGTERLDSCDFSGVTDPRDMFDSHTCAPCPYIHGRWRKSAAPARSAWWRSHYRKDLKPSIDRYGAERRDGKCPTAEQDQATTCDYVLAVPCAVVQRRRPRANRRALRHHPHQQRSTDP